MQCMHLEYWNSFATYLFYILLQNASRECKNTAFLTTQNHMQYSDAPNKLYIIGKLCSCSTRINKLQYSHCCPTCPSRQSKTRYFRVCLIFDPSYHHQDRKYISHELSHKECIICRYQKHNILGPVYVLFKATLPCIL